MTVAFCIVYVDRPIATFSFHHINETGRVQILRWLILPLGPLAVVALIIVLVSGLLSLSGRPFPRWVQPMIIPTIAVTMGIGAELILKEIFGRSDIWPTYIQHHVYAWDFMDHRDGWRSFPSGTAIGLFALIGVLLVRRSRWTTTAVCASLVICALVTIIPFHWLSDVIAGMFVGLTIGYATATLLAPLDSPEIT